MSPVLSIPLVPASCTNVFPEPEHASSFSSAPSHVASSCTNANLAFSSSFPSASPPELMPSHIPPSPSFSNSMTNLECSLSSARPAIEVQPSELASLPLALGGHLEQESSHSPVDNSPVDIALSPSESSANSEFVSLVPVPLDVSSARMTSHWQEQTLRVTPSEVMSMRLPLAASPPLEVSNAPVQVLPNSKSQEVTLGVTPHEVMPMVTSLPTSAKSSLHSDRSHVSPRPLSTVEISSSNRDPPSSLSKVLPILPTPPLDASLSVSSPRSSPSQPPPGLVQDDSLSDSLEDSLTIPIHPHSTPPQQLLGIIRDDSVLITLEVAPAPTSPAVTSIPQQRLLEVTHPEVSSTLAPNLHFTSLPSPLSSSPRSARFDLPFIFVTTAVLFSALLNVSTIIPTRSRKLWRKNEEISNDRGDVTISGKTFDFAQLFQLVQYKPHAARLVFDPGGFTFAQQSPHEDAHGHKPKTHNTARTLLSSLAATFVTCI
ncbi:hypothetical protein V8E53_003069 [Lactarius tabidus]